LNRLDLCDNHIERGASFDDLSTFYGNDNLTGCETDSGPFANLLTPNRLKKAANLLTGKIRQVLRSHPLIRDGLGLREAERLVVERNRANDRDPECSSFRRLQAIESLNLVGCGLEIQLLRFLGIAFS
jgi:hypothetical protein